MKITPPKSVLSLEINPVIVFSCPTQHTWGEHVLPEVWEALKMVI
jgi:hypothetical protein